MPSKKSKNLRSSKPSNKKTSAKKNVLPIKEVKYQSFKLNKKIKRDSSDIPSAWNLVGRTYQTIIKNWKILGGIMLVYAVLYFLLVRVAPETNLSDYEDLLDDLGGDETSQAVKTFTLAGIALASAGQAGDELRLLYGNILFIVISLVIIWALRHLFANKKFNVRDAFYKSMTPTIPLLIVVLIILVQLIPFGLGGLLYAIVKANNITISGGEDLIFLSLWGGLGLLSGYWLANSLMSLYAVTLPGMYPMVALRATKKLVQHRRWFVLRKILLLPVVVFALFFMAFLFIISVGSSLTFWFIDGAIILAPLILHTYLYHLYRSLV